MSLPTTVARDLRTLAERVWTPTDDPDWPVRVDVGAPAPGRVVAEQYVVVPSLKRATFLVPVGARAASRAAFGADLTTSSVRTRALGAVSSAGFGGPVGERLLRARLTVSMDPSVPRSQWSRWLLIQHLADELGARGLVGFLPVRRAIPNAKPTARLFDGEGRAVGYVKVGWSPATRVVVRNEAAALAAIENRLRLLQAPRLAAAGTWHGQDYAVAAPLPPGVRPWTAEPSTTPELLLDIVRSGQTSRGPLAGSGFAQRVRAELEVAAAEQPEAAGVLVEWLARLERRTDPLDFGRWHGDFIPGNLGQVDDRPVAWDWEFSDPDVPVGFDLVHWHFQRQVSPPDGSLEAGMRAADAEQSRLATVGVAPGSTDLVTSLFLLEVCTRAVRMAADGAGWNPKLYPALLDVARRRDVDAARA